MLQSSFCLFFFFDCYRETGRNSRFVAIKKFSRTQPRNFFIDPKKSGSHTKWSDVSEGNYGVLIQKTKKN
jgi:hypothetical protein